MLAAIGGKENVSAVDYCTTRLRFEIKDYTAVNEKAIKAAGAAGVIRPSKTACQVIIGPKVPPDPPTRGGGPPAPPHGPYAEERKILTWDFSTS